MVFNNIDFGTCVTTKHIGHSLNNFMLEEYIFFLCLSLRKCFKLNDLEL